MKLKTDFRFTLPENIDSDSQGKTKGVMRLVKVKDLLEVSRDTRVRDNSAYFYVVLLTRILSSLGNEKMITTRLIENLSTKNFAFLIDFMNEINHRILKIFPVKCGNCHTTYNGELKLAGEL